MRLKAIALRGRAVTSADGKVAWRKDGEEKDISDEQGALLLSRAPKGMFEAVSAEKKKEPKKELKKEEKAADEKEHKSASAPKNKSVMASRNK